ncbi:MULTISPECIES: alpha/beta hydrolase [Agrobacterium]|uniref:Alpha/beta fold hydrolase n=1 Tax=Agrobacterium tumefaciens TaxID=358 RepID=A0AAF0GZJ0_AGRTU|nr:MULTISPECIES: alpha/beta fold hydrolase [Agrobacterium]WGM61130.1 alpha/beta fold hydrolase [Agrobacterium tumefaciens]CVI63026.1 Carboxylesterase [Agrobacterium salinitolerans str. Hayward 0363]
MTFSFAGSQSSLSRPFPQAPTDEETKVFNPSNDGLSFFEEGTNGKAVMLVHGMSGAPAEMRLVARQFSRRGYSVFAPLLAGHGRGEAALRRSRFEDWLDSIAVTADWLATRSDAVFGAGICVGGKLSLLASHMQSSPIQSVALYSPCFHYDGWNVPRYYAILSPHIRWIRLIPFIDRLNFSETPSLGIKDERLRRMIAAMENEGVLSHFPGRGLVEMNRLGHHLKKHLPAITTPSLIIHSTEDDLSGPDHARYIAAKLGGPRALHWLNDSYHMIHVDREHRKVADLSARFFETKHAFRNPI